MAEPKLYFKKEFDNPLLFRTQLELEIEHEGLPPVSKTKLRQMVAAEKKIKDETLVVPFGFHTRFGGGLSKGHCHVYTNKQEMLRIEPRFRLVRMGLVEKVSKQPRKARKEMKNKLKKARGLKKRMEIRKA